VPFDSLVSAGQLLDGKVIPDEKIGIYFEPRYSGRKQIPVRFGSRALPFRGIPEMWIIPVVDFHYRGEHHRSPDTAASNVGDIVAKVLGRKSVNAAAMGVSIDYIGDHLFLRSIIPACFKVLFQVPRTR
jgi:hypothetical protein